MKLKKVGIALCLSASLLVLGACNSSKGSTSNQKAVKTEAVAFQKDINQKNERVWLITKSENFGKDSKIESAFLVKNGKVEVITPLATLRDLDKIDDSKVWDYLVKTEQKDYKEQRQQKIDDQKKSLEHDQGPMAMENYSSEKDLQEAIKLDNEILDVLNKTSEFKPLQTKINVSVTTDSSGNYTSEESINTVATPEMYALLDHSRFNYDLKSVINTPIQILGNSYLGYEMKEQAQYKGYEDEMDHYRMLTRKTDSINKLAFDKVSEKNVKEVQNND